MCGLLSVRTYREYQNVVKRFCDAVRYVFTFCDTCFLVVKRISLFMCVLSKSCNIVNNTICLSTTLPVIHVVIGGWKKSLVFVLVLRFNVASGKISKVKYSKILMLPMGVSVSLRQLSLIR